jgi:hypothetical protein
MSTLLYGAGTTPAGLGSLSTSTINPRRALITSESTVGTTRYIDAKTGDYVANEYGFLVGARASQTAVYLALRTVKGSASAMPELGETFTQIQVIGSNIENRINADVSAALSSLIDNGTIELLSTSVERDETRVMVVIKWLDLETGDILTNAI